MIPIFQMCISNTQNVNTFEVEVLAKILKNDICIVKSKRNGMFLLSFTVVVLISLREVEVLSCA